MTGKSDQDVVAMSQYLFSFYRAVVLENEYAKASTVLAALPADFDASLLTDPASATIATAQQTANDAYLLALSNKTAFEALALDEGNFTIAGTATSAVVSLSVAQADTAYEVAVTPKLFTGAPALDAFVVLQIDQTTTTFTAHITAPGLGNSVGFGWVAYRRG